LIGQAGNGSYIEMQFSMSGLSDLGISFATRGTSTGFNTGQWSYSTDGLNFTDFGPNTATTSTSYQLASGSPFGTAALDGSTSAYLRYTLSGATSSSGNNRIDNLLLQSGISSTPSTVAYWNFNSFDPPPPPPPPPPRLPQAGDVVFALSTGSAVSTFELVSGPLAPQPGGGVVAGTPWQSDPFIESVEFDNFGGIRHNVDGNLLGVNFSVGGGGNSGAIYSFGTNVSIPAPAGQLIGNTEADGTPVGFTPGALTETTLARLSVSPDNSKIAVMGVSQGTVIVYDYDDGDTTGGGASLANGRQTALGSLTTGASQGTAWLDNDTVIAFSTAGDVYEIDAATMTATYQTTHATPSIGSNATALAYNPDVSPYVYAIYGGFLNQDPPLEDLTANMLFILDPENNYALVHDIDLTTSLGTATSREIALDADGNLFIGGFGGQISYITAADLAAGTDNSSVVWYLSEVSASFNGLDIAFGGAGLDGDYNGDGVVDQADYVAWAKNPDAFGGTPDGYNTWKQHFGEGSAGSGGNAAVPEPASLMLVVIGMAALCYRRRAA
jgi:hypothetical protein